MKNCLELEECIGDFWLKLEEAVVEAGGSKETVSIERLSEMKCKDIASLLAPNGIRFAHNKNWNFSNFVK